MDDHVFYLPPGFRFHPSDEEIITHYLMKKIADQNFVSVAVAQANFNDCEPWDLPRKAEMGDNEWYFFCQKDRKYPTGMMTNRATKAGYWKTTGKDKDIFKGKGDLLGKKKTLVFYKGRAPRGQRTNWVMHEYRLEGKQQVYYNLSKSPQVEWVVCKVYHKKKGIKISPAQELASKKNSFVDDISVENPNMPSPLTDTQCFNSSNHGVESQQELEKDLSKSFSSSQNYLLAWFLHHDEEKSRAPFISSQGSFALSFPGKVERPSNSIASTSHDTGLSTERNGEASSAISKHQIRSLHSSDVQVLDFDSLLNYEFV